MKTNNRGAHNELLCALQATSTQNTCLGNLNAQFRREILVTEATKFLKLVHRCSCRQVIAVLDHRHSSLCIFGFPVPCCFLYHKLVQFQNCHGAFLFVLLSNVQPTVAIVKLMNGPNHCETPTAQPTRNTTTTETTTLLRERERERDQQYCGVWTVTHTHPHHSGLQSGCLYPFLSLSLFVCFTLFSVETHTFLPTPRTPPFQQTRRTIHSHDDPTCSITSHAPV